MGKVRVQTGQPVMNLLKELGFTEKQIDKLDENFILLMQAEEPTLSEPDKMGKVVLTFNPFGEREPEEVQREMGIQEMERANPRNILAEWMEKLKSDGRFHKGTFGCRLVRPDGSLFGSVITMEIGNAGLREL